MTSIPATLPPATYSFFRGLIDYAGLFPPAALSLSESLQNYFLYRRGENRWILGRFILSVSQLKELQGIVPSEGDLPLSLSLVTKNVVVDLAEAAGSIRNLSGRAKIESVEVLLDPGRAIETQWRELHERLSNHELGVDNPSVFLELPLDAKWRENFGILLNAIKGNQSPAITDVGIKLRCGGAPHGVPSPALFATALHQCAIHNLPLKFTAGLHHPISQGRESQAALGFFNVFFAAFVANIHPVSEKDLSEIISCSSPPLPQFNLDGISWLGYSLSASQIAKLRTTRVTSFGSCSFTEPTEESVLLGWLPATDCLTK